MYPCRDFNHNTLGPKASVHQFFTIFNPVFFLYRAPTFISTLRNGANARRRDSRLNTASWKIGSWTNRISLFITPTPSFILIPLLLLLIKSLLTPPCHRRQVFSQMADDGSATGAGYNHSKRQTPLLCFPGMDNYCCQWNQIFNIWK